MRLGVNVDHIATLRQQRKENFPDPVEAALIAQAHGADSIVAHLREDRRHIQETDLHHLKEKLRIPLAMEMGATPGIESIALRVQPARVCIVPEKRQELTTEGGLDVVRQAKRLEPMIRRFAAKMIEVSLFIAPDAKQVKCASDIGAEIIELHTGKYATLKGSARQRELDKLVEASELALHLKLGLHAGHGLDYENVLPIAQIAGMEELNIGFSIISQALFDGLAGSVRQMKDLICAAS